MASSQGVAVFSSIDDGLISLALGLLGVVLARWVFVNREQRRLGTRENWKETLPLTLVAMLISGVIIYERELGLSAAAFVGLGVGWAAVLLLEILGNRIQEGLRGALGATPPPSFPPAADLSGNGGQLLPGDPDPDEKMERALIALDKIEGKEKP